ncbi:DUF1345 domain-containing protein [Variovorax sp. J22R133]|uniref:DUF1345 domain-containing protein n=1 Tax=Variovorax brevis TaxID=3053503 RepID=UPI00257920D3|nr:DUF1345 domain-containing protein [Variovorax sp. J22R133]MDM0111881.1 DUF1345 domain-containing protein [Variovorax sp. J22R133]
MSRHLSTTTGLQRIGYAAVIGIAAGFAPWPVDLLARGLIGWCIGASVYLGLAWWLAVTFKADDTRRRAQSLDQPSLLILVSMLVVIAVSVTVIGMLLQQVKSMGGAARALHIALGLVSLASSWLTIHTIYAFHYAHRYYQEELNNVGDEQELTFPGHQDPDYFDFLYYSFVVGMTSQVSDVSVCSREMRRITLVHGVLSFAFNMLVLALSINVVASII